MVSCLINDYKCIPSERLFYGDPLATLKRVKEMGYTGVEIPLGAITAANEGLVDNSPEFYKQAIKDTGLQCYGLLCSWGSVQPEQLQKTIAFNKELGSPFLVIGSVATKYVETMEDIEKVISYMKEVQKEINSHGIITGYHNHDTDFTHVVNGKTFFEHIFDNTSEDFVMLLDTGNALAAGYDAVELITKYPNRSPFLHIKGYSKEKGYLAYIGDDDFDWPAVIDCAVQKGQSRVFDIEFGQRGDYDPFERTKTSFDRVNEIVKNMINTNCENQ